MACATIHLAIAKKYLEKRAYLNYAEVIAGTLYSDTTDNISHVRGKVNLYVFLKELKP